MDDRAASPSLDERLIPRDLGKWELREHHRAVFAWMERGDDRQLPSRSVWLLEDAQRPKDDPRVGDRVSKFGPTMNLDLAQLWDPSGFCLDD